MKKARKWEVLNKAQISNLKSQISNETIDKVIEIVLENRGITTKKEKEGFLHPILASVIASGVGIDKKQLERTLKRVQLAIEKKEKIVVFGDYDVDGITGTAILWETLYKMGANVIPYIPHRVDEGYGLSIKGIENLIKKDVIPVKTGIQKGIDPSSKSRMTKKEDSLSVQNDKVTLIITVDNGIVANEAVDFANQKGIEVIITDHHTLGEKLPDAFAIVHTTKLCGAGVAWMLSKEIKKTVIPTKLDGRMGGSVSTKSYERDSSTALHSALHDKKEYDAEHLDLVALATVADLVPLTGANRAILKAGLPYLQNTKRVGLKELFLESGINPKDIGVYEIGHIIGPRLNAMGRMESAMDSLRLLCTNDPVRAKTLAAKLGITNKERQLVTQGAALHAIEKFKNQDARLKNILFIGSETYEEGVIGLVAGKLVEEFYRPSIVLSIGEEISKASARSVAGFNIIDFIRSASEHLINAGGHPMAAGFTVRTEKMALLQETLEKMAVELITEDLLTPILKIDLEIPLSLVSVQLYQKLQELGPFGMANPEPVFMSKGVTVEDVFTLGKDKKHVKFFLSDRSVIPAKAGVQKGMDSQSETGMTTPIEAIAFGIGERFAEFKKGSTVDVAYIVDENEWQGRKKLQLKIKEIH